MDPFLTCQQITEFLADYVDGGLAPAQLHEFHRHLAVCPACVNYIETYKATRIAAKAAFTVADAENCSAAPEELIAAILAARKKPAR